jgi:C-terminal processing protease CtpA/Prc
MIKHVLRTGAAVDTDIKSGDIILAVNEHTLTGCTHAQAVDVLRSAWGLVQLTILPSDIEDIGVYDMARDELDLATERRVQFADD